MESPSDSTLMERVRSGDTAQLALLFERYHVGLFRYAMHLTRNRPLSEDLVQEVFFRVLKYAIVITLTSHFLFGFMEWLVTPISIGSARMGRRSPATAYRK